MSQGPQAGLVSSEGNCSDCLCRCTCPPAGNWQTYGCTIVSIVASADTTQPTTQASVLNPTAYISVLITEQEEQAIQHEPLADPSRSLTEQDPQALDHKPSLAGPATTAEPSSTARLEEPENILTGAANNAGRQDITCALPQAGS